MSITCPNCGCLIIGELPRVCAQCGQVVNAIATEAEITETPGDLRIRAVDDDADSPLDDRMRSIVKPGADASPNNAVAAIVIFSIILCGVQGAAMHPHWPSANALQSNEATIGYGIGLLLGLAIGWDFTRWIKRPVSTTDEEGPPSEWISYLMLMIPVAAGIAMLFSKSLSLTPFHVALIGAATVVLTAVLAYFNMKQMAVRPLSEIDQQTPLYGPVFAFVGVLGFWLICFPVHFVIRKKMGAQNLIVVALIATAAFFAPMVQPFLVDPGLPAADDAQAVQIVQQSLEEDLKTKPITLVGPSETSFDPATQTRICKCTVTSKFGEEKVAYKITWQDRSRGVWQVHILDRLPLVNDPDVLGLVHRILEDIWINQPMRNDLGPLRVLQPTQTNYDAERQQRTGAATVHTAKGEAQITFQIEWGLRNRQQFRVQVNGIPPP